MSAKDGRLLVADSNGRKGSTRADQGSVQFWISAGIDMSPTFSESRIIGYAEIENRFREIVAALELHPSDEELILEKGAQLSLLLGLCLSQMSAPDSRSYPEKSVHREKLTAAQAAITFKLNNCTVEEISRQIAEAYKAITAQ